MHQQKGTLVPHVKPLYGWPLYGWLVAAASLFLLATPAVAGIRIGGQEAPSTTAQPFQKQAEEAPPPIGGIRQSAPPPANAAQPTFQQGDLLKMAEEFRAKYRQEKAQMFGEQPASAEYRYGFVVAFFDTKSLLDTTLLEQLERLDTMDGLQFQLVKSLDNITKTHKDFTPAELERLSKYNMPMARDDLQGKMAKNYKVDKFPTVLYETPSGDVVRFHVPTTMEAVFRRISKEARLADAQAKQGGQ